MTKKITLWILALVSVVYAQNTTETKSFSLNEAITYGVQNSANSVNAGIDIEKGKHFVTENIAMGLPQINGNIDYMYYIKPAVFVFPNVFGGNPNEYVAINASPLNSMQMSVTAAMPVVSGQYFIGIQAAKSYYNLLSQQKTKADLGVKEEIVKAYYLALIAMESKNVVDSTLRLIDQTVYETEQFFNEGLVEDLDVKQLKLNQAQLKDLALQLEGNVQLTQYALKYQMNYPLDQPIVLTDNLSGLIASNDFATLVSGLKDSVDVKSNIDYQLINQKLKMDQFQVKLQMASAYPTLSTFFQVGGNFFNNERWLFLGEGTQSTLNGVIWGFNLKVPIFSSWNRVSKLKQLKLEVKKTENTRDMVSDALQLGYLSSKVQVTNSYANYNTAKDNFDLAGEIRRVNSIKYKEGLISSMDLTLAERQYFDAQQKYFQTLYDLLLAKISLDKSLNKF